MNLIKTEIKLKQKRLKTETKIILSKMNKNEVIFL